MACDCAICAWQPARPRRRGAPLPAPMGERRCLRASPLEPVPPPPRPPPRPPCRCCDYFAYYVAALLLILLGVLLDGDGASKRGFYRVAYRVEDA
jgi:hypothetical protein